MDITSNRRLRVHPRTNPHRSASMAKNLTYITKYQPNIYPQLPIQNNQKS
jgi:hypothetical protein